MKNIKLFTALLAVAFLLFVTSCNKEETTKSVISNPPSEQSTGSNIDELIKTTGIDIYALASSSELLKYFKAVAPISEEIAKKIMKKSKSFTEEKIARMAELIALISEAAQNQDFELVDVYFEELKNLMDTMMNTVDFYQCEVVQRLNEEAEIYSNFLNSEYPSFFTLDSEQQRSIIDAIIEITSDRKPPRSCAEIYVDDIRAAEQRFAITLAGCLLLGPIGSWVCAGVALGIYCVDHHQANLAYADCINGQ